MLEIIDANKLSVTNTKFGKKKNRRWTWISPNKEVKNKIDFISTNRPEVNQKL